MSSRYAVRWLLVLRNAFAAYRHFRKLAESCPTQLLVMPGFLKGFRDASHPLFYAFRTVCRPAAGSLAEVI